MRTALHAKLLPMESFSILGLTLDTAGTLCIAVTALLVHMKVSHEKRIDREVISEIRWEMKLGVLGVILIIAGYVLQVMPFLG